MTHSTVRAREREARCAHRTPPREFTRQKTDSRQDLYARIPLPPPGHIRHGEERWRSLVLAEVELFMSKNDLTSVRAPKVRTSVIATKRTKARLAKLKTSSWYEGAARSVGINKGTPVEKRER